MRSSRFIPAFLILLHTVAAAQIKTSKVNPVADILFRNVKTTLTETEKNEIASKLPFVLSGKKDEPFALDKDSKDFPFTAVLYPVDMNNDGKEEIFISFGNTYTSGHAGSSVILYIPDASGKFAANLNFPGMTPDMLTTMNKGYNDLLIGGPGFEFPIWRWNGKAYVFYKTVKDSEYQKLQLMNIADVSKKYQDTLK